MLSLGHSCEKFWPNSFVNALNVPTIRFCVQTIFVPGGCASFGQHEESRHLERSNFLSIHRVIVSYFSQSDLSDLTLSMRRVTGRLPIAYFRCWTFPEVPEVAILDADQKNRGLWGRECMNSLSSVTVGQY